MKKVKRLVSGAETYGRRSEKTLVSMGTRSRRTTATLSSSRRHSFNDFNGWVNLFDFDDEAKSPQPRPAPANVDDDRSRPGP